MKEVVNLIVVGEVIDFLAVVVWELVENFFDVGVICIIIYIIFE